MDIYWRNIYNPLKGEMIELTISGRTYGVAVAKVVLHRLLLAYVYAAATDIIREVIHSSSTSPHQKYLCMQTLLIH